MSEHPWCSNVARDQWVRLKEDAAAAKRVALPDHRDLPQAVAELRERVARLEAVAQPRPEPTTGSESVTPTDGLRTDMVTLEVTHHYAEPLASWLLGALDGVLNGPGENVFVMDSSHEITRLTAERDAALRERDAHKEEYCKLRAEQITQELTADRFAAAVAEADRLRARVSELERAYSAECDARAQAQRELSDLNDAIRARESGEERDSSYAALCREAAAARERADSMMPAKLAPAANAGGEDVVVVPQTVVAGNFAQIHWNNCCRLHRMAMDKAGVRWKQGGAEFAFGSLNVGANPLHAAPPANAGGEVE